MLNTGSYFLFLGKDYQNNLYVGNDKGQILISSDKGSSWNLSFNKYGHIHYFVLTPASLVIAGDFGKIYKKQNDSTNLNIVTIENITGSIKFLLGKKNDIYAHPNSNFAINSDNGENRILHDSLGLFYRWVYGCSNNNRLITAFRDETSFFLMVGSSGI